MKGVVFTEFLEMVELEHGLRTVNHIIETAELPHAGAYTSVGTYDHNELIRLATALSRFKRVEAPDLVRSFGAHLFTRFAEQYPQAFAGVSRTFDFLSRVDGYIHVEVRKLYPDAELPVFSHERPTPETMRLHYSSTRPFADLAHGLIQACVDHFQEDIELSREEEEGQRGTQATFVLSCRSRVYEPSG